MVEGARGAGFHCSVKSGSTCVLAVYLPSFACLLVNFMASLSFSVCPQPVSDRSPVLGPIHLQLEWFHPKWFGDKIPRFEWCAP